jgi:tetratricopeptide (TPR) repeat protein
MVRPTRSKLVLSTILLFLIIVRCAAQDKAQSPSEKSGVRVSDADRASFEARGIKSPDTVMPSGGDPSELDLAEMQDAIGEAREASPETLASLEKRGAASNVEVTSTPEPSPAQGESESDESEGYADTPAEPKPSDPAAAEKPAKERPATIEELKPEPEDERRKSRAGSGGKKMEEAEPQAKKDKFKESRDSEEEVTAPRTLLPKVAREVRAGKLLVQGASGKLEPMEPRALRVIGYVEGARARTIVDYVFENKADARLEGTFFHPLPADSSPAGFAMFDGTAQIDNDAFFQGGELLPDLGTKMIDPETFANSAPSKGSRIDWGKRKEARVVEQKRAREVYEEIVRSNVDPALMEWSGGSNFQARVFPIEARSLKRIVVAYEQMLVFDGVRFRYGYAMPSTPSLAEVEAVLFVDRGHGKISETPQGARATELGRYQRYDLPKASGAIVSCAVEPKSANTVLRGKDKSGLGGDTFYAEVRPFVGSDAQLPTGRALILVDTSLSSAEGGAHERRAKMIEALLAEDQTIKEYAVALFDLRTRFVHDAAWRANTAANRAGTIGELREVFLEGATSFSAVLTELERNRSWAVDGGKTTAFLLSDGEITWGVDRLEVLAARHPVFRDVRWISYRFGESAVNQALFDMLSTETGGRTVTMLSEEEIPSAAVAHRAAPSELVTVEVRGAPVADLVIAGAPKQVYPGQTLRIAGRLPKGGAASLSVSVRTALSLDRVEVPLGGNERDDLFAPRAWAELYARKLIELDDARLDRMVVALSQHYRLANARASFLVLDNEQQAQQFQLKNETVDLANLEVLRRREEDQRRDKALGIGIEEVSADNRELIELLRRKGDGVAPILRAQPLVESPYSGGEERLLAEADYRRARTPGEIDFLLYDRIARARALAGDTAGAVRALSSVVELRPRDGEAMRLVGYALLALSQYEVAAELFERLRLLRPFEPSVFLEEALALDALGKIDLAARNYEILLARVWPRHAYESRTVAEQHYARLLSAFLETAKLSAAERAKIEKRLSALGVKKVDFQLTTLWSTDSVDIDLWIFEPNGEKCFYSHRETTLGGKLFWDVTDGLGPELYHAEKAHPGQYDALIHFYGSGAPRLAAPTAMLLVVDRELLGKGGARTRKFQMRMLPKRDAVLMLRTDVFE